MRQFLESLRANQPKNDGDRTWIYIPYDQLNDGFGPLSRLDPNSAGIVLVESAQKASRRPYHKQKLALILANQRHFALEQARRGVAVDYVATEGPYRDALRVTASRRGPLKVMEPAERELRVDIAPLIKEGLLEICSHEGWLTRPSDFTRSQKKGPPWRMDSFYREVRKRSGILMEDGKPVGGKYSYDSENRQFWPGEPPAAVPPLFSPDAITLEVAELIEERFARHPGSVDLSSLPTTQEDALALWGWAMAKCLPNFGPFEDAMSTESSNIFHTRISALVNIHRLLPRQVVHEVLCLELPLASQEGFLRQVIGWREFMHHVHAATDGFRNLPGVDRVGVAESPGDGGWGSWTGESWNPPAEPFNDGGSQRSAMGADRPVPPAYWGTPSGMNCLDTVVNDVWREAYSHHITRLMVLANLGTLFEVSPRDLSDWFWVAYVDAFDWVVEPNVMGMGTFGLGELFTTKPYVSGQAYIKKMSNYCQSCTLKKVCPVTRLYWAYMSRHRSELNDNHRLRMMMASERKRDDEKKRVDREVYDYVTSTLAAGQPLKAEHLKTLGA